MCRSHEKSHKAGKDRSREQHMTPGSVGGSVIPVAELPVGEDSLAALRPREAVRTAGLAGHSLAGKENAFTFLSLRFLQENGRGC